MPHRHPVSPLVEPTRPDWLGPDVWPFPRHALDVGGARITYTDVGVGPTLLFCHAGMWSFIWRDVITRLQSDFRCVAFDPPGSGLSERVATADRTLAAVRDTTTAIIEHLDLRGVTLVMHDLGGVAALAAASPRADRVSGLVAVNTFGWRPRGLVFRGMLALFGSAWMRGLDAATAWLPWAATTRVGIGRHLDRASRRAFRRGMDREGRRTMHRLFASARRSPRVYDAAETALDEALADRPLLAVFGAWGDYLRFRPQWRRRFPQAREVTIRRGLHFPMCDDPDATAQAIAEWHREVGLSR